MENRNGRITQALYRKIKGLALTLDQEVLLQEWLQEEANLQTFRNLTDEQWLAQARKKYFAPGKEEGLKQLRQAISADSPIAKRGGVRWLWVSFFCFLILLFLVLYFGFPAAFFLLQLLF